VEVEQGKRYRFRFINAGAHSSFRLNIPQHEATLVEVDSTLVKPVVADPLDGYDINVAQRMSVIVKADQNPGNYYVTVGIDEAPDLRTAFILHYKNATAIQQLVTQAPPMNQLVFFNKSIDAVATATPTLQPFDAKVKTPDSNRTLILNVTMTPDGDRFLVNNKTFTSAANRHLLEMAYKDPKSVLQLANVYELKLGETVDLVIHLGNCFMAHPWHIHGNAFWDMGGGNGFYNEATSKAKLAKSTVQRDTVSVRSFISTSVAGSCGWRVLRLQVTNPGLWHMHCHIHDHMMNGMQIVLAAGLDKLPQIPTSLRTMVLSVDPNKGNGGSNNVSKQVPVTSLLSLSLLLLWWLK